MRGMLESDCSGAQAHALLRPLPVTRRIVALVGFFAVLFLAATLLYRVYIHHINSEPYNDEETAVVGVEVKFPARSC